jgi:hypothetical protein
VVDDDMLRDLASLAVPLVGSLAATGDPWEPYRLLDPGGEAVLAVTAYLRDLQASGLPASRKEDGAFRRHLVDHDVTWTEARRCPARRLGEPDDVYETTEAPWPSAEGFRVIWVRSSHKVERDADSRSNRCCRHRRTRRAEPDTGVEPVPAEDHRRGGRGGG